MQLKKTDWLTLTIVAIAATTSGLLAACSSVSSNQSPDLNNTMDHRGMNHSMAMDLGPADANYDLRFIDAMSLHHQGAIAMAKAAEQKTQRPQLKQLASNIIKAQSREETELLQKWRTVWYSKADSTPMAYHHQMGHMMAMSPEQTKEMMMQGDLGAADTEFDRRFIDAMIPHHQGALIMAKDALSKSKRPEIQQLAKEIISSQQAEIEQMQQWRQAWYPKSVG